MNQQQKQNNQQDKVKQIEKITLEAGAEMVKNVLPTLQGGRWDNYTIPQKVYYLYIVAERKAKRFVQNGGFLHERNKPEEPERLATEKIK